MAEIFTNRLYVCIRASQYDELIDLINEDKINRTVLIRKWLREYMQDFPPDPVTPSITSQKREKSGRFPIEFIPIMVSLTDSQLDRVKEACLLTGKSFADFIRMVVNLNLS